MKAIPQSVKTLRHQYLLNKCEYMLLGTSNNLFYLKHIGHEPQSWKIEQKLIPSFRAIMPFFFPQREF